MQKSLRILAAVSFFEGLIALLWLASLPASGGVFSPVRLGSLFLILVVSLGWLLVYFQKSPARRWAQWILNWQGRRILACSLIAVPLLALSAAVQREVWWSHISDALYARALPLLFWGSILSLQFGLFLLLQDANPDFDLGSLRKPVGLWLGSFLLVWGFISFTKIGLTPDAVGLSWGPPGTPVTLSQVILVFATSISLACFYLLFFMRQIHRAWLADFILFIGLWALAASLWWEQPMIPSHFAPARMPPNFEYYPNSDAAIFDRSAYQLLYGAGFDTQLVRRPLYVGMLALYHRIAGPSYEATILLQILTLAFIPALIYLLVTKLSNRLAGLLAGGLIALREANAIYLSGEIIASHAKLMMSDLVAMLGVVVVVYLAVILLRKPDRNSWGLAILGACLGLTILVRAQALILLPLILIFFLIAGKPVKTGLRDSLMIFLGMTLILLPWVWRNWNLTGTFVLDDRGEEELLARNYSPDPAAGFPVPFENETEREFSARLRREIFEYAITHPGDVSFFVSNHFFHNLLNSVLSIAPLYTDDSPKGLLSQVPYWGEWDGKLTRPGGLFLFMNLSLIALGLALAQRQNKLAGWFPFMAFIFYSGGNALVRSSGWRFSLPVDWTILAYYCIALAYLPGKMGAVLQPGKPSTPPPADTRQRSFLLSIIFALLFLAGASVPIAERLIPNRDFETFDVEARSSMFQTQIVSPTELGAFLQQKDAVFVSGIALYPRYYRPDSHIYLADMPTDFSYLHLLLLSRGHEQVVLPLKNVPGAIPNASPVSVLGCRAEGYISAWAVLVHSQPEQILIRDPRNSLHCPLAESN